MSKEKLSKLIVKLRVVGWLLSDMVVLTFVLQSEHCCLSSVVGGASCEPSRVPEPMSSPPIGTMKSGISYDDLYDIETTTWTMMLLIEDDVGGRRCSLLLFPNCVAILATRSFVEGTRGKSAEGGTRQ
jgi:hypothetical protein